MADWMRHFLGLPCRRLVVRHEFVLATHPGWMGFTGCIYLPHSQANRCMLPLRCHVR